MDNSVGNTFTLRVKLRRNMLIVVFVAVLLAAAGCGAQNDEKPAEPGSPVVQEFDPNESAAAPSGSAGDVSQRRTELEEVRAALEVSINEARAKYETEMKAREDRIQAEIDGLKDELKEKTPPELEFQEVIGTYEECGELVTLTHNYEVSVLHIKDGFPVDTKLLYRIPGTIKIGVNFNQISSGILIDDKAKTVTVTIPAAYIVSNAINESGVERFDISRWLLDPVEDKDYLAVAGDAKVKAEEDAKGNDMLATAQKEAALQMIELLEPLTSRSGYQIIMAYE